MPMRTREEQRAYQLAWIKKRRQDWIDANGPCQLCDSTEDLEVDHINPATKRMHVSSIWSLALTNPKRIAELAKCQVLCRVCHLDKTGFDITEMQTKPIKHGTENAYLRRACRCDECRLWRRRHRIETGT